MGAVETIILVGSLLSAVGVIIASAVSVYKIVRKWDKWTEQKDAHDKENYMAILRLTIMSHEMPLTERISAGDKYVFKMNGNGEVKKKYYELLDQLSKEE